MPSAAARRSVRARRARAWRSATLLADEDEDEDEDQDEDDDRERELPWKDPALTPTARLDDDEETELLVAER